MIVEKDVDFENIERAGTYKGYYFILGGTLSLLERKSGTIRAEELKKTVKDRAKEGLEEVVLALSASPDGEHTTLAVREILSPLAKEHSFKISMLGRGLSTGLELEYSDPETIKNALKNRA
jgi:recombination protein RecR